MNNRITDALNAEATIRKTIEDITMEIDRNLIDFYRKRGLNQIADNIVIVSLKNLDRGKLLPSNYIPSVQAQFIKAYLSKAQNMEDFLDRIKTMIITGYAFKGSSKTALSPCAQTVLKEYAEKEIDI